MNGLRKMRVSLGEPVEYALRLGETEIPINALLGKTLKLHYQGNIYCTHCNRAIKKTFNQGYCFPCLRKLAQCDTCIIKPETCHYDAGTCREPEWAEQHCMQDHYVYLANSSGIKVGITRQNQIPTRWIDQGAIQALPIAKVRNRHLSGLMEVALAQHVADKTNWRAMLKGTVDELDLVAKRDELFDLCSDSIAELQTQFGASSVELLTTETEPVTIQYPVLEYPTKVSSLSFDKTTEVGGTLMGIKGQYLMFDTGVINMRKFTGYEVILAS